MESYNTIIQDFQTTEVNINQDLSEERKTEWFDLNDRDFAYYDFNVVKLFIIILTMPLLLYHLSKMVLPDVDYWGKKSTQQQVNQEEYVQSSFYSIKVDNDRDGIPDSQINYESISVETYYEVNEFKKTIIAAKAQNAFTYLAERSIQSLFGGTQEDGIFNEHLTEDHLDSNNYTSLNAYTRLNAGFLQATYRKFTENITTTYIDNFEQSTLTIIDFDDEGQIEEQRIYTDDFDTGEVDSIELFFSDLTTEHSVTDVGTGQQATVSFDSEIPYSHPANISWDVTTWGPDQVSVKYDSLQVIIGEDYFSYTTNAFESTIIIRIPNRFSIYDDFGSNYALNDGWVEFEVKGILMTPPDGQVYYTSSVNDFAEGTAKTSGHYFYVDSDLNGFYETVYILEGSYRSSFTGTKEYNVISIGYNYDGKHDFAPYEKIDEVVHSVTDFDNLARESAVFGLDWVYNFKNLKRNALLFEQEESIWSQYKPKDQIFEIHKLVEKSSSNPEYSQLFYEVRHKTYSEAWKQYRTQLVGDIAQQVFMTVTAFALSIAVEIAVSAVTAGFAWLSGAAHLAKVATYFLVYTAMTKFFIDIKIHETEARTRSETFYPVSSEIKGPTSLNEKMVWDRFLQDSMAAALIGHPGGYYTTVSGGEQGEQYTGQLLVSPPNPARSLGSFGGMLEFLWENFWNMGESDPDSFTALRYDNMNLNYFLLTSELPANNHYENYSYPNTDLLFNDYNAYALNTLGYLERKVRYASDNKFNAIRATVIDGTPHYEFINREENQRILPLSGLYRPIVLSEARYNATLPKLGHLIINTQTEGYSNTKGIDAYDLDSIEVRAGYKAKISINDNGFEYPIDHVSIDVVRGNAYYARDIIINESDYAIDQGNLYFKRSIEDIVSDSDSGFEAALDSGLVQELIYYKVHVYFEVFVPDTNEETSRLALAQATQHVVMDYFNQYTYAEVTANMISEIAYTETMTFWSTIISAVAMYAGSALTGGATQSLALAGVGMVKSAISEVFEEIIKDSFIETLVENTVDMWGGSENLAMWLSALATSARETAGALGQFALSIKVSTKTDVKAEINSIKGSLKQGATKADVKNRIDQVMKNEIKKEQDAEIQGSAWTKLRKSGFFKGMFMVMPAIFFGGFSFLTLKGISAMGKGTLSLTPKEVANSETENNNFKKGRLSKLSSINQWGMRKILKQSAQLEAAKKEIESLFKEMQDSSPESPPQVSNIPSIDPNPAQSNVDEAMEIFKKMHPGEGPETGFDIIGEFFVWYDSIGGDLSGFFTAAAGPPAPGGTRASAPSADPMKDIEARGRQAYIDSFSDLIDTIGDHMVQLNLISPSGGYLKPLTQISQKLNLATNFIETFAKRLRKGNIPIGDTIDILFDALDQNLRNLVSQTDWTSINEKMLNLYRLSGSFDFNVNRFGIPQSMRRLTKPTSSSPFIKPQIDLDTLINPILTAYQRQISMFAGMDISINSYSQRDLRAIMTNRGLYNWYGLIYKFTQIRDINNQRLTSPGHTRHVVGYTTLKMEDRFDLYIRGSNMGPNMGFSQPIYDTIKALNDHGIDPHDAFDLEILEINWNPFDLVIAERNWIAATLAMNPVIGFNSNPGGGGYNPVSGSSAIPAEYLIEYIAKGYKDKEILLALQNDKGLTSLSYDMVVSAIQKKWGSLKEAQEIYLAPILKQLIEFGYNDEEITTIFGRGKTTVSKNWIPRFLGYKSFTDARNNLIKDKLKKLIMRGYDLAQIYQAFPAMSRRSVTDHIKKNWGGTIGKARTVLLKPYFDFFFSNMYSNEDIIKRLNFDETVPLLAQQGSYRVALMNEEDLLTYIVSLVYKTSINVARYEVFSEFIGHFI